jgi:hypothetical protein
VLESLNGGEGGVSLMLKLFGRRGGEAFSMLRSFERGGVGVFRLNNFLQFNFSLWWCSDP